MTSTNPVFYSGNSYGRDTIFSSKSNLVSALKFVSLNNLNLLISQFCIMMPFPVMGWRLRMSAMLNGVSNILKLSPPLKVFYSVIKRIPIKVSRNIPFWTLTFKRYQHKPVDSKIFSCFSIGEPHNFPAITISYFLSRAFKDPVIYFMFRAVATENRLNSTVRRYFIIIFKPNYRLPYFHD